MLVVGEIVKVRDLELDPKSNKSPEPLLDGPATSEHMSTPKALFDVIMHKVYYFS